VGRCGFTATVDCAMADDDGVAPELEAPELPEELLGEDRPAELVVNFEIDGRSPSKATVGYVMQVGGVNVPMVHVGDRGLQ